MMLCGNNGRAMRAGALVALAWCYVMPSGHAGAGVTERINVDSMGAPSQGHSTLTHSACSDDGRYVVFTSEASGLVPNDTNNVSDVFLRDRVAGTTTRISVGPAPDRAQGSAPSTEGSISADGDFIVFTSAANNFGGTTVPCGSVLNIYLYTRATNATSHIANGISARISADGNYVAFNSTARLRPDQDPGGCSIVQVYTWRREGGPPERRFELMSRSTEGIAGDPSTHNAPSISGNGRFVAFFSSATNLVAGDTNGRFDVFVRDRNSDGVGEFDEPNGVTTYRASQSSPDAMGQAVQGNDDSFYGTLSRDGRFVSFWSAADNLAADPDGHTENAFVHELSTRRTLRIARPPACAGTVGRSAVPSLSADGRFIVFASTSSQWIANDVNNDYDMFVHDRDRDRNGMFDEPGSTETTLVSVNTAGMPGNGDGLPQGEPAITGDARWVVFSSVASNLVDDDTNGTRDIFIHDLDDYDNATRDQDNCPVIANNNQADADTDGWGDACDNCPAFANPSQQDGGLNGIGDACEADCNSNQTPDDCDLSNIPGGDCNTNLTPDECDIGSGYSSDGNTNRIPDECEPCQAPSVVTHPQSCTPCIGESVTFNVQALGSGQLAYQWRKNGILVMCDPPRVVGCLTPTLVIDPARPDEAGIYDCVVTNVCGSVTSNTAILTIQTPPAITHQPESLTVCLGGSFELCVQASGSAPLSYSWTHNSVSCTNMPPHVSGCGDVCLTVSNARSSDAGTYVCTIGNDCGSVMTVPIIVTVTDAGLRMPWYRLSTVCDSNTNLVSPQLLDFTDEGPATQHACSGAMRSQAYVGRGTPDLTKVQRVRPQSACAIQPFGPTLCKPESVLVDRKGRWPGVCGQSNLLIVGASGLAPVCGIDTVFFINPSNGALCESFPDIGFMGIGQIVINSAGCLFVGSVEGDCLNRICKGAMECCYFAPGLSPRAVTLDADDNIYLTPSGDGIVRKLGPDCMPIDEAFADGMTGAVSQVIAPAGIFHGSLFVACGDRVMEVWLSGPRAGQSCEFISCRGASGVAVDPEGYLYITEPLANRIRKVGPGLPGDMNGDGYVDVDDVVGFAKTLLRTIDAPLPILTADMNCDGCADGDDIEPFVQDVFAGSTHPPCMP